MSESNSRSYRLAEGVLSVPVEEEAILLSIGTGKYYGVKGAMRHLLEDLREGIRFDEMVERTCARYDVVPAEASRDLEQILPRLIAARIIETGASR
jgi:hypothetical protein